MDKQYSDIAKSRLDELYKGVAMLAESYYIYVCDIKNDYSRWSERAVDYFGLPGKYMYKAGEIWAKHILEEERQMFEENIAAVFSGRSELHDMQYHAQRADGTFVVCTCKGTLLRDGKGEPEFFIGSIRNNEAVGAVDVLTGLKNLYGFFEDLKAVFWQKKWSTIMLIGFSGFSDIKITFFSTLAECSRTFKHQSRQTAVNALIIVTEYFCQFGTAQFAEISLIRTFQYIHAICAFLLRIEPVLKSAGFSEILFGHRVPHLYEKTAHKRYPDKFAQRSLRLCTYGNSGIFYHSVCLFISHKFLSRYIYRRRREYFLIGVCMYTFRQALVFFDIAVEP